MTAREKVLASLEGAIKYLKDLEEESRRTNYSYSHHKPGWEPSEAELDDAVLAFEAHHWSKHNSAFKAESYGIPTARVMQVLRGPWMKEARPSDFKDAMQLCVDFLYVLNGYDDTMDFVKQMQVRLVDERERCTFD